MNASPSRWPAVSLSTIGGVPTLVRDGKPWFGWGAQRPYLGEQTENHLENFVRLSGAGFRHFHLDATCTEDIYHPALRFWRGPGQYDGTAQDRYFSRVSAICPEALLHLRVYVGAPDWWLDAHPDHLQVYHDGSVTREVQNGGVRKLPSLASPLWRAEACEAMRRYVGWLLESGWSRKVFGLFLCNGITWEWAYLGSDGFLDYSPHMAAAFRAYLKKRYGTDEALSAAWGRAATFAEAAIPSAERRSVPGGEYGMRPAPAFRDVVDFQQCLSEVNAGFIVELAAAAKEASERKVLVGAFYGYTLTAREQTPFTGLYGAGGFHGGHHALGRVLRSADVDYYGSPFNYADRALGSGLLYEHMPVASLHAHGKAFFDENDLYTHTGKPLDDSRAGTISVGIAQNPEESIAYLRLAFGQAMVRGKHQWLTELSGWLGPYRENYGDPAVLAEIARLQAGAETLVARDRSPVAECAFVLDEESVALLTLDHKGFLRRVYQASVMWGHCGAPFDLLLLDDLLEDRLPSYRLVIPACVKRPEAVASLRAWLTRTGTKAWWDGTPEWYPPAEAAALDTALSEAGVHRYLADGSTVWANASMVLVHVPTAGERTIQFRAPCNGIEFFSGQPFSASEGKYSATFQANGVSLFLIDPSA